MIGKTSEDKKTSGIIRFGANFLLGGLSAFLPQSVSVMFKVNALSFKIHLFGKVLSLGSSNQLSIHNHIRIIRSYIISQAFTFALYDWLKSYFQAKKLHHHFPYLYFVLGGLAGLISRFVIYPFGYHKILLINDILQENRLREKGVSNTQIFMGRIKKIYKGFALISVQAFIKCFFYFGLYDYLKNCVQSNLSLSNKFIYCLASTQISVLATVPIYILIKNKSMRQYGNDQTRKQNWYKNLLLGELRSLFSLRTMSRSVSLLLYDLLKKMNPSLFRSSIQH